MLWLEFVMRKNYMNSQHMAVPDTHDSVRSHSCGCCSFSHSRQGLLQLTQGWRKNEKDYFEEKKHGKILSEDRMYFLLSFTKEGTQTALIKASL